MTNEEAIKLIDDRMCFGRGKWSEHHRPVIDEYWQAGEMAIKALEAEPHWIPVTERLPERSGDYLVTRDIIEVYEPEACDIDYFEADTLDWDGYGNLVIAWMPLPEPFKGVTE